MCTFDRVSRRRNTCIKKKTSGTSQDIVESLSLRLRRLEETFPRSSAQRTPPTPPKLSTQPSPYENPVLDNNASVSPEAYTTVAETSFSSLGRSSQSIESDPLTQPASWTSTSRPSSLNFVAPPAAGRNATSVDFSQLYFGGCHFGRVSSSNGMPLLSEEGCRWISLMTGEDVSFDRFRPGNMHETFLPMRESMHQPNFHGTWDSACALPERYVVQEAVQTYNQCSGQFNLPPLDSVLFVDIIRLAYDTEEPLRVDRITARCCVFAMLSIAFLFKDEDSVLPNIDGDVFASRAHYMLPAALEEPDSVSLQAISMLYLFQCCTGRLKSAALLHSLACRTTLMLGGHAYHPIPPFDVDLSHCDRESRQLRILFWFCYVFDKDLSLRLSQPPLLQDDYCDLTLPEGYAESYIFVSTPNGLDRPGSCGPATLYPRELILSRFKDTVSRLLYSAAAAKKSGPDIFRDIRQLDDELETWRQSIAPEFRPSLSVSDSLGANFEDMKKSPKSMWQIILNLEYHHLMTTIHRASGRCAMQPGESGSETSSPYGVVQSSLTLALEASRATLKSLRAAIRGLPRQAFWFIVFYPTTAMLPLFLNVLQYPMTPHAASDLELLLSAAQMTVDMPVLKMTRREMSQMQLMDEFARELVRLGNRAIARERERRAH